MLKRTASVTIFLTNSCAEAFASAFAFDANVATVPRAGTAAQSSVAAIRAELAVITTATAAKLQLERDKGRFVKNFVRICIIIRKHEGDAIEAQENGT